MPDEFRTRDPGMEDCSATYRATKATRLYLHFIILYRLRLIPAENKFSVINNI
jgi:hypothetical protein